MLDGCLFEIWRPSCSGNREEILNMMRLKFFYIKMKNQEGQWDVRNTFTCVTMHVVVSCETNDHC